MKEFAKAALDKSIEAFIVYMRFFNLSLVSIYPAKKAQIVLLIAKEVKIVVK